MLGTSPEGIAAFDDNVTTLVTERVLAASNDPAANPADLLAARRAVTAIDIPRGVSGASEELISGTLTAALIGALPPLEDLDLSGLSNAELADFTADMADELGRLTGRGQTFGRFDEIISEFASVRAELANRGANGLQIADVFLTATTIATQRALALANPSEFDAAKLNDARDSLRSASLPAFTSPNLDVQRDLNARADELFGTAATAQVSPELQQEIAALDNDALEAAVADLSLAFSDELARVPPIQRVNPEPLEATQSRYAAIINQLSADGATPEAIAEFGEQVRSASVAIASQAQTIGLFLPDSNRLNVLFGEFESVTLDQTDLARDLRLLPQFSAVSDQRVLVAEALEFVLGTETDEPFDAGNLRIASPFNLANLLARSALSVARGFAGGDESLSDQGAIQFDQIRDEIVRRSPGDELSQDIISGYQRAIALNLNSVVSQPDATLSELINPNFFEGQNILTDAVGDFTVEEPFGIASTASFEGDNGADPANIFVIEVKPNQSTDPTANFGAHGAVVSNVIETQLQEAGQSYALTNLQADAGFDILTAANDPVQRGSAVTGAIDSVTQTVLSTGQPAYLNLSLGLEVSPESINNAFESLADTAFVEGLDLTSAGPVTLENLETYIPAVRTLALTANDPAQTELREALGGDLVLFERIGSITRSLEDAIAADIDVFVSVPNSSSMFSAFQFASDADGPGSVTYVGNNSLVGALETNEFTLPGQEETLPGASPERPGGIDPSDNVDLFYRGSGVDVFAAGAAPGTITNNRVIGTSFAAPEMVVNAILGAFNPDTELRG